ncbi:hypothetical protein [Terrisporobacter sp.]|nr:hypothetical protein [Terrisporobacter sp.]
MLAISNKYGVLYVIVIGHKDENKNSYDDSDVSFGKVHYNVC